MIMLLVLIISGTTITADETEGQQVTNGSNGVQTLNVEEKIEMSFAWSIPSKITFSNGVSTATVKVHSAHMRGGVTLKIFIDEENSVLTLKDALKDGPTLSFQDGEEHDLNLGDPILTVTSCQDDSVCPTSAKEKTIVVKMNTHPFQQIGTYSGNITFSAVIES